MTDNIRKILNIISYCNATMMQSLLIVLDFEKAFDSIDFTYFKHLLQLMNFGDNFFMASLYHQTEARIKINNT